MLTLHNKTEPPDQDGSVLLWRSFGRSFRHGLYVFPGYIRQDGFMAGGDQEIGAICLNGRNRPDVSLCCDRRKDSRAQGPSRSTDLCRAAWFQKC